LFTLKKGGTSQWAKSPLSKIHSYRLLFGDFAHSVIVNIFLYSRVFDSDLYFSLVSVSDSMANFSNIHGNFTFWLTITNCLRIIPFHSILVIPLYYANCVELTLTKDKK